jgi:steroid 5-alpha reductase family enzyme
MAFANLLGISGIVILLLMIALWLLSLLLKNSSIVDIFWGIGFIIVTWLAFMLAPGYLPRKQLVATLVTIWGLRLAIHMVFATGTSPKIFVTPNGVKRTARVGGGSHSFKFFFCRAF